MRILAEWGRRIWFLLNRRRLERELEKEMAAHREMMNDPRRFGNTLKLREEARDIWGWNWLDRICQDTRYGCRVLRKSPGFTLASALILSLGIGLNLAFFQIVNTILLQPLPVRDPDTLVRFYRHSRNVQSSGVPYPATQFFRQQNNVLSTVLTQTWSDVAWGDDAADRLRAAFVSANFFHELGYGAAHGRVFHEPLDERPDAPPVVVLSHDFWRRRLNADPRVIGQTVRLNNRPAAVIGVAPLSFPGLRLNNPQVWMPIHQIHYFNPGSKFMDAWDSNNTEMYGRLRPGVHAAAARDGMRAAVRELARQQPNAFRDDEWLEPHLGGVRFQPPKDLQEMWTVILLVGSLTMLVLVVACSNLSSLVLSRANYRMREFSVRTALGAGRWRVTQQLLTESLLLSFCGLLGGLLLGHATAKVLAVRIDLPPHLDFTPDWRTFAAALGFSLFSVALFGLIPAWKTSRKDLTAAMKEGSPQGSGGVQRSRFQQILVTAQVACSCVLLIVASLMVRGLQRLLTADPGFEFERVVVLDPSLYSYGIKGESARSYWLNVKRDIAAHPESEAVALTSAAPLSNSLSESNYRDAPDLKVTRLHVESEFFSLMRIPILAGRNFEPADDHRAAAIISKRLAERMYGTMDVVGKGFPKTAPERTIVGVAGDARVIKIQATNVAEQYSPLNPEGFAGLVLLSRAQASPERLLGPLRTAARRADNRVLAQARMMKTDFEKKLQAPRLSSLVATLTGSLALLLACMGIFGLVAYRVTLRTREIGIRVALGATRQSIVVLLLRQLTWPIGCGIVLGAAAGIWVGRFLEGDPFYLDATDPAAPMTTAWILALSAGLAAILPARRALRIEPMQALRHE